MTFFNYKNLFVVLTLFVLFPFVANASEIRLETSKVVVRVGEQFLVNVVIESRESLNAVEGRLVFSSELLRVVDIQDGNSVINFWVEKPKNTGIGDIAFSGITPGGFSGANNHIFSVVFETTREDEAVIGLEQIKVLQNDGLGTEAKITKRVVSVTIKSGGSSLNEETIRDMEPPESFVPTVTSDKTIFDGKFFLVFATQDKGLGIDRFEVREGRWGWYRFAESPYLLRHQKLNKTIFVKAIDKAGNERVVTLEARVHAPWWEQYEFFAILMMIVLTVFIFKVWPRFIK